MKESGAFTVAAMTGEPAITHDDKLLLRGQKTEQNGSSGVGLSVDWWRLVDIRYKNGQPVIVRYGRKDQNGDVKSISVDEWQALNLNERALYRPWYLKGLDLGGGAVVTMQNNQFDLRLTNLFEDFGSRYRSALESMIELVERGVIRYMPRTEPNERNRQEAIRNRLRRKLKPTEYEHDVLIPGDLGKAIWSDLRGSAGASHVTDTVVYLKGYSRTRETQSAMKFYDIGIREGLEAGRWFKLETTILKGYFRKHGIGVRELTEQPDIQELLRDRLTKDIGDVIRLLRGETVQAIQNELDLSPGKADRRHTQIAQAILQRPRTLTDRVADLERAVEENRRRIERLEGSGRPGRR